jgi:hypothetical protein
MSASPTGNFCRKARIIDGLLLNEIRLDGCGEIRSWLGT